MLQPGVFPLDVLHLAPGGIADSIAGEPVLTCLHEVFQPGIVSAGMNAFPVAEISDRGIPAKAFQYNANLFFGGELAAGEAFNILDELLGFFTSGFSQPDVVGHLLYHGLLLL